MKLKYIGGDSDYDEDFTVGELYEARHSSWRDGNYDVTDNHGELWLVKPNDECFIKAE